MIVAHGRSSDTLVVLLLDRTHQQVLTVTCFADGLEDLFVLLRIGTSPHDQGYVNRVEYLLGRLCR